MIYRLTVMGKIALLEIEYIAYINGLYTCQLEVRLKKACVCQVCTYQPTIIYNMANLLCYHLFENHTITPQLEFSP